MRIGESQANLGLYLNLIDAVELVFDRVFDGENFLLAIVEMQQRRVERCRLTAAGGSGHQNDAMGPVENIEITRQSGIAEAKRVEAQIDAALIENTQDDAFAVHGRHGGDAQVDFLTAIDQTDTAVLGQAGFGDIEVGHQLDARNHRGAQIV